MTIEFNLSQTQFSENGHTEIKAKVLFDHHVETPAVVVLGPVVENADIKSSMGPFRSFPEYKAEYPEVVVKALGNLYQEYNHAFQPLVEANREWDTDYQYCFGPDGKPVNYFVQVDMV